MATQSPQLKKEADPDPVTDAVASAIVFLLGALVGLAIMVPCIAYKAFVVCKMWEWFLVAETGVPVPGVFPVTAFLIVLKYAITGIPTRGRTAEEESLGYSVPQMVGRSLSSTTFYLLALYLFHKVAENWHRVEAFFA